jgi:hypothetical protein
VSTFDPSSDPSSSLREHAHLDRWLEQLAGADPPRVDLCAVRRRARRVRLTRVARHVGAAAVAVGAALAVSQSMIGGAAQPGDWSADEAALEASAPGPSAVPGTDAPVESAGAPAGGPAASPPLATQLRVPLTPGASAWARDHAFDSVVALDARVDPTSDPAIDTLDGNATPTGGQRVTSW